MAEEITKTPDQAATTPPATAEASVTAADLEDARAAQKAGILDQMPPVVKARMLKALQPVMQKEREEALKPIAELAAQPKSESTFIDQLMTPVRTSMENPGAAVMNTVRGIERSFNPLPLVNLATPGRPHINDDLETLEGLFAFPVIRGSELAARMFVPDEQRPSLTTFAQVVKSQKDLDSNLRSLTPGVQEGAEAGSVLAGIVPVINTGLKVATSIARGLPKAARAVQEYRAGRALEKAVDLNEKLLDLPVELRNGPISKAILERPEEVRAAIAKSGSSANDIALQLKNEIETIGQNLGKTVGKYREAALADNKTRMDVPTDIAPLLGVLRERTTFGGKSVFSMSRGSSYIERQLQSAERAAALGVTTPNQAMVWIDMLDDIIDYGGTGGAGSNAVKGANHTLMEIRRSIKSMLRQNNTAAFEDASNIEKAARVGKPSAAQIDQTKNEIAFQLWSNADTNFAGFKNASDGLLTKLEGDSRETLIANLLNKGRTPLRDRIEQSLNYMEQVDPTAVGHGKAFFSRLADATAAEKIQSTRIGIDRVKQESTNEIVRYWTNVGSKIGIGAAGFPAGLIGNKLSNDSSMAYGIGAAGGYVGNFFGGLAGKAVGKVLANPERVLDAASKAKDLSDSARKLSKDMLYLNKLYGPDSSIALLDLIGSQPVVNELIKFTNTQRKKESDNGKGKVSNP